MAAHEAPPALEVAFLAARRNIEAFLLRRVRCQYLAEDLCSEIYLRLYRIEGFSGDEMDARRYLFRMAANIAIDYSRVTKRQAEILYEQRGTSEALMPSHERVIFARSELAIVDQALAELAFKARQMFYYSRVEGMTHDEIALRMGVSKSLVDKYVVSSARHCRQRLRELDDA